MDNQIVRVISALCEDVGTPIASRVLEHVKKGEWIELQKLKIRPRDYGDGESYWKDALVVDFLRKCDLPSSVDREAAAIATFRACEAQNYATNERLTRFISGYRQFDDPDDERVSDFISQWRKDVSFVLGKLPDNLTPRFSPGATYADTGFYITTPDKMSSRPQITQNARCILPQWGETLWFKGLAQCRPWLSDPWTVKGNIFFTVPKDGTKFRGCAKEPSINVAYQLDVGRLLKNRLLKTVNIDLRGGQSIHRDLARQGSIDGKIATIDMSNASDTMCRAIVKLGLPAEWHELLDSLRSTHTRVGRQWFRLEKFSSMGNGFTFELETIIFATLARTVIRLQGGSPDEVRCYGDDLIVPSHHYRGVMAALQFFGFTPNQDKTFAEGPFRESCGGDYWGGVSVRAHYLESIPDEPQKWIALANGLRRVASAHPNFGLRWPYVRRAWLRCLDPLPSHIRRCRGPQHLGDIVIHDDPKRWELVRPLRTWDPSWDLECVMSYQPVALVLTWNHWIPSVALAGATLGLPSKGISPRGGVSGWRLRRAVVNRTSSFLPEMSAPRKRGLGVSLPQSST